MLKSYSGDAYAAWQATGILIVVEILALGALTSAWEVYRQRRLMDHYLLPVALAVIFLNVRAALSGNKRREQLSREFDNYPLPVKIGGGLVVIALIVLAVIGAGYFGAAYAHLPR